MGRQEAARMMVAWVLPFLRFFFSRPCYCFPVNPFLDYLTDALVSKQHPYLLMTSKKTFICWATRQPPNECWASREARYRTSEHLTTQPYCPSAFSINLR